MEKMISYIFGNIEMHDKVIGSIVNEIKKQNTFNKSVTAFAVATTAWMIMIDMQRKEDMKKIEKLTKEVEELRETKGE